LSLGVYLGWHVHPWEDLVELVQHAEALGYSTALVDGDVSLLAKRQEADCLDGWTVTTALIASTASIEVGSLRLVHQWNAARLAQAVASVERIAPGRLRFQISIGDWKADARFGFPVPGPGERIAWLDETLDALRALWGGETVTRAGRFVRLDEARVRPALPAGSMPISIAAQRPRMLEMVAAHADVWEVNLPPIRARVERAAERLAEACERRGRDPAGLRRSMLLFARPDAEPAAALAEFRRLNPWFHSIPDADIESGLVLGEASRCRDRLAALASDLRIDQPALDLSGVPAREAHRALEALAPGAHPG
jgi:alkanesulfonate monooxygenase SsuD/methylene tetrahydromethanopterin reductase-like flavin-dependent oxidoreductase (luciferase family)